MNVKKSAASTVKVETQFRSLVSCCRRPPPSPSATSQRFRPALRCAERSAALPCVPLPPPPRPRARRLCVICQLVEAGSCACAQSRARAFLRAISAA
eukprot:5300124-Pleurochrysis_carterae.AAC.2